MKTSTSFSTGILLAITLLFTPKIGFSQAEKKANFRQITEIELKDTVLIDKISELIDTTFVSEKSEAYDHSISPFKQGAGYISLYIWNNQIGDFRTKYVVKADLNTLEVDNPDSLYPQYYTYIKERIVLIYCLTCLDEKVMEYRLSEESKSSIREKLEPFLVPTYKVELPGKTGELEEVDFRIHFYSLKPSFEILSTRIGKYQINNEVKEWF